MKCMKLKRFLGKKGALLWIEYIGWNTEETDALHRGLMRIFYIQKEIKGVLPRRHQGAKVFKEKFFFIKSIYFKNKRHFAWYRIHRLERG